MQQSKMQRKPSFIVVGAQRCGTTWLHENLRIHPEIFLPEIKELNYFSDIESRWAKGEQWYFENFKKANKGACVGEITPEYFVDPLAPKRIFDLLGKIKIICVLRSPVERAFSNYKRALREQEFNGTFADFMENDVDLSVTRGIYAPQLSRYIAQFGKENVLILSYDDIAKMPLKYLRQVYSFLNISTEYSSPLSEVSFNVGGSSNLIVKMVVNVRNVFYKIPFGKETIKAIQRSRYGNLLMQTFLEKQSVKENDLELRSYHSLFTKDVAELYDSFSIAFVSDWNIE